MKLKRPNLVGVQGKNININSTWQDSTPLEMERALNEPNRKIIVLVVPDLEPSKFAGVQAAGHQLTPLTRSEACSKEFTLDREPSNLVRK